MNSAQLNKVLKIIRYTGDRIAIMDSDTDQVMMLMSMDSYEELLGGRPLLSEFPRKLKETSEIWPSDEEIKDDYWDEDDEEPMELSSDYKQDIDDDYDKEIPFDPDFELADENNLHGIRYQGGKHTIPIEAKENAFAFTDGLEESLHDVPEEEEEQFYLEPIE